MASAGAGGGTGERWGAGIAGSTTKRLRPIGWADELPSPSGLRTYPRAPLALSIVDSVVFGRDLDFSGPSCFDENFKALFHDSAGSASWENGRGKRGGIRTYSNHPGQKLSFGPEPEAEVTGDAATSGGCGGALASTKLPDPTDLAEDAHSRQDFPSMFKDSAGLPSWAKSPRRGLKQVESPGASPRPSQNERPPELSESKRRPLSSRRPTPRSPWVPPQQALRNRSLPQRPTGRVILSPGESVIINSSRHR